MTTFKDWRALHCVLPSDCHFLAFIYELSRVPPCSPKEIGAALPCSAVQWWLCRERATAVRRLGGPVIENFAAASKRPQI